MLFISLSFLTDLFDRFSDGEDGNGPLEVEGKACLISLGVDLTITVGGLVGLVLLKPFFLLLRNCARSPMSMSVI